MRQNGDGIFGNVYKVWYMVDAQKMMRVISILAKSFVPKLCVDTKGGIVKPGEEISFFDQVDFVKSFVIWKTD